MRHPQLARDLGGPNAILRQLLDACAVQARLAAGVDALALGQKVETHPGAVVKFFKDLGLPLTRIGFEAGPLSQWLHVGLTEAGFETVLMETRHVKKALSA